MKAIKTVTRKDSDMNAQKYQTLGEILEKGLPNDATVRVYAFGTAVNSPARVGSPEFFEEDFDGMTLVISGEALGKAKAAWSRTASNDTLLDYLIKEEWIEYDDPDCYRIDPGCPHCDGAMYGADAPSGDNDFVCLLCGWEGEWDNEAARWKKKTRKFIKIAEALRMLNEQLQKPVTRQLLRRSIIPHLWAAGYAHKNGKTFVIDAKAWTWWIKYIEFRERKIAAGEWKRNRRYSSEDARYWRNGIYADEQRA